MPHPCPNCQQPVEDGRTLCPNCGARVEGHDTPVWPPPPPGVCPRCGWGLPPSAAACPHCGLRLTATPKNRGWMIAGTTCGVTALVVSVIVVVLILVAFAAFWNLLQACDHA